MKIMEEKTSRETVSSSMDNLKWYNNAAEMNNHQNTNTAANNDMIDLTLKIGLPFPAFRNNQQGLVNEGAMNIEGEQKFNGGQYAWASDQMGNNSTVHNMNYGNVFPSIGYPAYNTTNSYNFSPTLDPPRGYTLLDVPPSYNTTNSYNNFSPTLDPTTNSYNNFSPTLDPTTNSYNNFSPTPPPPPPSGYTLLDVPPRRAAANQRQRELEGSSVFGMGGQGQRTQRFGTYNDPNKRCTNYNCNTNDTPMWRKGPLGPKTLCNACGIKYRKEKEKRMERKAEAEAEAEVEAYRPILMDE